LLKSKENDLMRLRKDKEELENFTGDLQKNTVTHRHTP
jgi:hypothetical protein